MVNSPYQTAKSKGYTDEQIVEYFSKKDPQFIEKYQKALSSGHSPDQIFEHVSKKEILEERKEPISSLKSFGKSALKGAVEGISSLGRAFGPLQEKHVGEFSPEKQTETLNKLLPTNDTFAESAIRRGLKLAPSAVATPFGGPIQSAVRSGAAGVLGETAKKFGAGELGQTLAELSAFMTPTKVKGLIEKGEFKSLIQGAKKFGMKDEEIAPLIQGEFKQKWLSKVAKKAGKTEEKISNTKKALDRSYDQLADSEIAKTSLSMKNENTLLNELSALAEKLPSEARTRIAQDMKDLVSGPITGQSLMNLWKDINYYHSKGEKSLGVFKGPMRKAISSLSPEFEKDFDTINQLYSKFYPMAKSLKPGEMDKFISKAETLGLVGSVITWNLPAMITLIGEKSARKIASEMLTNPRFQKLTAKMMKGIKENRVQIIKETSDEIENLINQKSK